MIREGTLKSGSERKRFRSPPYPFVALPKAIERAKSLHDRARHQEVGLDVLGEAWGYGLKSSGLVQTASALMQFGLLVDRGSREDRRFQLSPEAIRLLQHPNPESEEYQAALQRAARRPKIFAEVAQHFSGKDVSETNLEEYLMNGRRETGEAPYSGEAAKEVIARYKETVSYAGMELNVADRGLTLASGAMREAAEKGRSVVIYGDPGAPARIEARGSETGEVLGEGETLLDSGVVGAGKTYRILVRGEFGLEELELLIERLEVSKRGLTKGIAAAHGKDAGAE